MAHEPRQSLLPHCGRIAKVGGYHGGGSPIMEQIAINTQYDIESRKKLVRYIAA